MIPNIITFLSGLIFILKAQESYAVSCYFYSEVVPLKLLSVRWLCFKTNLKFWGEWEKRSRLPALCGSLHEINPYKDGYLHKYSFYQLF